MFTEYQGRVLSAHYMFTEYVAGQGPSIHKILIEYEGKVSGVHNMFKEYVAEQGSLSSRCVYRISGRIPGSQYCKFT